MIHYFRITCAVLVSFFCLNLTFGQNSPHYYKNKDLPCLDKKFTIVLHWVNDSLKADNMDASKANAAIVALNKAFEPICVSFEVCKTEFIEWYQFDTLHNYAEFNELDKRLHQDYRINLYIVNEPLELCGNADFNSIHFPSKTRLTISKSCLLLNPLPHFIGSIFGLPNTESTSFGAELANESNCATTGDKFCDTPADPGYGWFIPPPPCSLDNSIKDPNGQYYTPDISNFMSQYFGCQCKFSREQYIFMVNNYLSVVEKSW
ncbi:MAG TPA: hypothetical protein VK590_12015 [Saprospiraceae bacterium]|nr:hypothetical protein [Saprospiraceae bacterium]